jgi:hypothetical protein
MAFKKSQSDITPKPLREILKQPTAPARPEQSHQDDPAPIVAPAKAPLAEPLPEPAALASSVDTPIETAILPSTEPLGEPTLAGPRRRYFFVLNRGEVVEAEFLGQGSRGEDYCDLLVGSTTYRNCRVEIGGDPGSCYYE